MSSFDLGILIAFIVSPLVNYIQDKLLTEILQMENTKVKKALSIYLPISLSLDLSLSVWYILSTAYRQFVRNCRQIFRSCIRLLPIWLRELSYNMDFINNDMVNGIINNLTPKIMEFSTALASVLIPFFIFDIGGGYSLADHDYHCRGGVCLSVVG